MFIWSQKREATVKWAVFFAPWLMFSTLLLIKMRCFSLYDYLLSEDLTLESIQSFAYIGAGLLGLIAGSICLRKRHLLYGLILVLFALMMFFAGLEEISWGQRLLGLSPPAWVRRNNIQSEMNLHNLRSFQPYLHLAYFLAGLLFSFAWLALRHLLARGWISDSLKKSLVLFIPGWYLMSYGLPAFLIYGFFISPHLLAAKADRLMMRLLRWLHLPAYRNQFMRIHDQEVAEFFLAIGFFLLALAIIYKLKRLANQGPTSGR